MQETPEQTLANAKRSLAVQRDGGTHRPGPRSIGKGSAGLKMKSLLKRVRNIALAVVAIWIGAGIASAIFGPLLFWGLMATLLTTIVAIGVFAQFPKVKVPKVDTHIVRLCLERDNKPRCVERVKGDDSGADLQALRELEAALRQSVVFPAR